MDKVQETSFTNWAVVVWYDMGLAVLDCAFGGWVFGAQLFWAGLHICWMCWPLLSWTFLGCLVMCFTVLCWVVGWAGILWAEVGCTVLRISGPGLLLWAALFCSGVGYSRLGWTRLV
jgi:hypothetical protein